MLIVLLSIGDKPLLERYKALCTDYSRLYARLVNRTQAPEQSLDHLHIQQ